MIEIACSCDDGIGLFHSHIFQPVVRQGRKNRYVDTIDTGWVRISVDWRAVARELARDGDVLNVT